MNPSTNGRGRIRVGSGMIRLCGFGLVATSFVKFLRPAGPVAYMGYLGYENGMLLLIAVLELAIGVAFLFPRTRSLGLLLVSSYFGGAIAADLANHPFSGSNPFVAFHAAHHFLGAIPATAFLLVAWTGVWLRHPDWFWSFSQNRDVESGRVTGNRAAA